MKSYFCSKIFIFHPILMIFGSRKPEFYALNDLLTISRFSSSISRRETRNSKKNQNEKFSFSLRPIDYRPIWKLSNIGDYRYRPIWKKSYRSYTVFWHLWAPLNLESQMQRINSSKNVLEFIMIDDCIYFLTCSNPWNCNKFIDRWIEQFNSSYFKDVKCQLNFEYI